MNEQKAKKDTVLSFRVEKDLKEILDKRARQANRTTANFVVTLLTKALEDIDRNERLMQ